MIYRHDYFGFVYIWRDRKRRMFYIGSHMGSVDDGYICSSKRMLTAYRKRPEDFRKRRILYWLRVDDRDVLLQEEKRWLDMVRDNELSKKYYNASKRAWGLSFEELSIMRKNEWMTPEYRAKMAALWKDISFREKISKIHKRRFAKLRIRS